VTVGTGGWPIWTLLGSVCDHSELHSNSSGSTWTQTSTVNGTSSTTSGSYSSSSSTPSETHTEAGTVPGGPPEAPTYSGPDDADFDTLLTALAADAAGAYTTPTTRAEATDAAIASFTALDDDGNPSTPSGAIYTALSTESQGGSSSSSSSSTSSAQPAPGGYKGGWWNPLNWLRGLYTGDPNAPDEYYAAARGAAGQSLLGNAAAAQQAAQALDVVDPTPLSGLLDAGLDYAQGNDSEAGKKAAMSLAGPAGDLLKKARSGGKLGSKALGFADEAASAGAKKVSETTAAERRAYYLARGVPESEIGPSGYPKIHTVQHPSLKRAEDAARAEVGKGGTTVKHPSPAEGEGHFHGVDQRGNKSRIHHEYPQ
jgi:hypothetical protein